MNNRSTSVSVKPMKLVELKARVRYLWATYTDLYGDALVQPENFKPDIRKEFGDLRRRDTWEKAYSRYKALNSQIGLLDAHRLILFDFNFTTDRDDYEYRHQIFDEWLALPDGLDLIKLGLEQIFSVDFTPREREDAHGFFELVQEHRGAGELPGIPVEPVRRIEAGAIAG
jgi:hypothetical protein